jgi:hypothetical protein
MVYDLYYQSVIVCDVTICSVMYRGGSLGLLLGNVQGGSLGLLLSNDASWWI